MFTSRSRTPSPSSTNGVPKPSETDKYLLRVTAGPSYDISTHRTVAVNSASPTHISSSLLDAYLNVRIRNYHGLPTSAPPTDETYFGHPLHTSDLHSVGYTFIPKRDINGDALVTGFDFDHSIKDRLPPGFKTAMRIVTTMLDPGIYADPYSDKPFCYGPALSSFFAFRVGEKTGGLEKQESGRVIEEGADGSGAAIREKLAVPAAANKRRKHFLKKEKLEEFVFEAGRVYGGDFFNPYLDFANFALKLPGFSISVVRYIDNKTHELRYVLKDRETGEVGLVVIFTLLFGEKMEEALRAERGEEAVANNVSVETKKEEEVLVNGNDSGAQKNLHEDDRDLVTAAEDRRPRSRHSSDVSVTPSSLSETSEDSSSEAVTSLSSTLYSALSTLGFGAGASSSGSSAKSSKESSPSRKPDLKGYIHDMENGDVEDYLRSQNTST